MGTKLSMCNSFLGATSGAGYHFSMEPLCGKIVRFELSRIITSGILMVCLSLFMGCRHHLEIREDQELQLINKTHHSSFVYDGTNIRYYEFGIGDPMILLHGYAASSLTWRFVLDSLSFSHRLIVPDLKGFGSSDKPIDTKYSARDQAEMVKALIDFLGLNQVTLVGNSLGGAVAMETVALLGKYASQKIKGLVLIDTVGSNQSLPLYIRLATVPMISALGLRMLPSRCMARLILTLSFHDKTKISERTVDAYTSNIGLPNARHVLIETANHLFEKSDDSLELKVKNTRIPVLIIWGEHDEVIPIVNGLRLHKLIPNSVFAKIPECGHMPQEEKPKETSQAILSFIGSIKGE